MIRLYLNNSTLKQSILMRHQSNSYKHIYAPVNWEKGFEIIHYLWNQPDHQITRLHSHNGLEVGLCLEGTGIFVVENKNYAFTAGDLVLINDQEMHFARSSTGTISKWHYFCVDPVSLLGAIIDQTNLLSIGELGGKQWTHVQPSRNHPQLKSVISDIISEMQELRSDYQSAVRALVWRMLILLHRLPGRQANPTKTSRHQQRIASALEYMATHLSQPISIDQLAEVCNVSSSHFRKIFIHTTGHSPTTYLTSMRMRMASSLLCNTDHPILNIALQVGFQTLSNFSRQFRKTFDCTPSQYRNTMQTCSSKPIDFSDNESYII